MKILRFIFTVAFILFANQILFSAPPPPPAGSPGCWPPPCVPIDGGITFLIAAGAAYGAKKLYNSRKNRPKFLEKSFLMKALIKQNAFVRFIFSAGILYLVLFIIYQFVVKKYTYYDQKFIGSIIHSAEFVLKLLGYKTFSSIQDLDMQLVGIDGSNGVWVGSNCNAITLFTLFSVFIIAYPGNQKGKLWFIPMGIISIHILNILRVVALAMISFYLPPEYLAFNHTYTFTFIIYAFIFMLWMIWINKYSGKERARKG